MSQNGVCSTLESGERQLQPTFLHRKVGRHGLHLHRCARAAQKGHCETLSHMRRKIFIDRGWCALLTFIKSYGAQARISNIEAKNRPFPKEEPSQKA